MTCGTVRELVAVAEQRQDERRSAEPDVRASSVRQGRSGRLVRSGPVSMPSREQRVGEPAVWR